MDPLPLGPVASIVRAMHDEVVQQLAPTKEITHSGEGGRAREEIVRRFLRRFVPQGLGIDTGFVIDAKGQISRQVDIKIYRDNYHPILEIGGLRHFLAESVVAVIENKATIASRSVLEDAMANVRSVKDAFLRRDVHRVLTSAVDVAAYLLLHDFDGQRFPAHVSPSA